MTSSYEVRIEKSRCLLDVDDGSPASELAKHISELSEQAWCAGWHTGVEYWAWERVLGVGKTLPCSEDDVAALRKLSALAGGWVYWLESDASNPEQLFADTGVRFVPMDEWLARYEAHRRGSP